MHASKGHSYSRKQLLPFLLLVLIVVVLPLAAACTSPIPQELTASKDLWDDKGLMDYDFTLERQCFCPEDWRSPVNIQVRDGRAVSVTYVSGGGDVTGGKFDNADTIDKLFTILENAYAGEGDFEQKAENINVTCDARMGYPAYFFIDVSRMIADEEQGFTVINLVAR